MPASQLACIDFMTQPVGTGPNPRVIANASLRVFDFAGVPVPNTQVNSWGAFRGLNCGYRLEVTFRRPVRVVCMSLVRQAAAGKVTFFSPAGSVVGIVPTTLPQNVVQHVACNSTAIKKIVAIAPSDETLLLELCSA